MINLCVFDLLYNVLNKFFYIMIDQGIRNYFLYEVIILVGVWLNLGLIGFDYVMVEIIIQFLMFENDFLIYFNLYYDKFEVMII